MTQRHATERDGRPGRPARPGRPECALISAIHDAFRRDLDYPAADLAAERTDRRGGSPALRPGANAAHPADERRFRFGGYSRERLWAARWLLFEFPEVQNLVHLGGGVVTVLHDGEPRVPEWIALLDACGFALEPMRESSPEPDEA
jgi:hypothetical protein